RGRFASGHRLSAAAGARRRARTPRRGGRVGASGRVGRARDGGNRRRATRPPLGPRRAAALARRRAADRGGRIRIPAVARRPAGARIRGNRPAPARVGLADRRLSGPGIPELASKRARALTRILCVITLAAGSAHAQLTLRSPGWNELSDSDRRVLAPLAPDWGRLDAQQKQKWLGLA